MTDLLIATVQFNVPWAAREQIRLFAEHVADDHALVIVDNSTDPGAQAEIRDLCVAADTLYLRVPGAKHEHPDALNFAAERLLAASARYVGFVDHDVFPRASTSVVPLIRPAGFFGIGQTHRATGARYVKPSFAFFDREWLAGRTLDFDGIRGEDAADDGDCGSMLAPLFTEDDWARLPDIEHGYKEVRGMDDDPHVQSWGVEIFGQSGEWVHAFNLSRWLAVPDPDGRERLVREMVEAL